MPGKDPAFLFFTLEWLQVTAKLFPAEKGVLIDLLCHQHRDGSIDNDPIRLARTVGLTVDQFEPIWSTIRLFFDNRDGNRMVNQWLEEKMTERSTTKSTKTHVRSILSRYAVLCRQYKGSAPEIVEQIKKEFNVIDYQSFELEEANQRLTNWWTYRFNQLVELGIPIDQPKNNLVIEDENENNRLEDDVGGMGEEGGGREGWTGLPGESQLDLPLPELKAGSAKMLMGLAGNKATDEQVQQLWVVFKVQNFTGKNWYSSPDEAFSHFINWSKTQKINGTSHANAGGAKLGTSDARTEKAQRWGS